MPYPSSQSCVHDKALYKSMFTFTYMIQKELAHLYLSVILANLNRFLNFFAFANNYPLKMFCLWPACACMTACDRKLSVITIRGNEHEE